MALGVYLINDNKEKNKKPENDFSVQDYSDNEISQNSNDDIFNEVRARMDLPEENNVSQVENMEKPNFYTNDNKFNNTYAESNGLSPAHYTNLNKSFSTYPVQHGTQARYPIESWFRNNYGLDRTSAITPERYTTCYPGPIERNLGLGMTVDDAVARQSTWRNNEKKVLDGYISKNANFYRKNYSDELEEYEAKRWWGEDEF